MLAFKLQVDFLLIVIIGFTAEHEAYPEFTVSWIILSKIEDQFMLI